MNRLTLLALLVPAIAGAAPVPKEKGKKETLYFPTAVGAKKVMRTVPGDTADETTETVTKVEEKDGFFMVTVERAGMGAPAASVQVYEVSAKGVGRLTSGRAGAKTPYPLLRLDVKAGDTWVFDSVSPAGAGAKVTHTMGQTEEVETPGGKFTALRVESKQEGNGVVIRHTSWHAQGIGVVRDEAERGGRRTVRELKAFTPGMGEKKVDEPKKGK